MRSPLTARREDRPTPIRTAVLWCLLRYGELSYIVIAMSFGILFFIPLIPPVLLSVGVVRLTGPWGGWLLAASIAFCFTGRAPKTGWFGW
jgi:hypothetical protein